MKDLHPSFLWQLIRLKSLSNFAGWVLLLALWGAISVGAVVRDVRMKTIIFAGGTIIGWVATPIRRMAIDLDRTEDDTTAIATQAYQNWLARTMEPSATITISTPAQPPALFEWSRLVTDPDAFPHLLLLGKTGAGKTWLAERLLQFLGGFSLAITPHRKPSDFQGITVVGGGRDYKSIGEALKTLVSEMQERYDRYDKGDESYPFMNVVIDEFPAIAANCPKASTYLKTLVREARKVKIRILLLSQGDEVKTLDIEGEGSLRECFTFIRLRGFAEKYAKQLKDEQIMGALKQVRYPCLVEDELANSGDLLRVQTSGSTSEPPPEPPGSTPVQVEPEPEPVQTGSDLNPPELERFSGSGGVEMDDFHRQQILELRDGGLNQAQIIFVLWKARKGGTEKYKTALAEYRRLMGESA